MLAPFINYFRDLAIAHRLILHNPTADTAAGAVAGRRFARISTDEFVTGINTQVAFPAMLIELYEAKSTDSETPTVRCTAAFSIFATANPEITDEVVNAFELTESILQDILQKMYQDAQNMQDDLCGLAFGEVDFSTLEIMSVGPVINSEYGWRCEFSFEPRTGFDISSPPAPGTFS